MTTRTALSFATLLSMACGTPTPPASSSSASELAALVGDGGIPATNSVMEAKAAVPDSPPPPKGECRTNEDCRSGHICKVLSVPYPCAAGALCPAVMVDKHVCILAPRTP